MLAVLVAQHERPPDVGLPLGDHRPEVDEDDVVGADPAVGRVLEVGLQGVLARAHHPLVPVLRGPEHLRAQVAHRAADLGLPRPRGDEASPPDLGEQLLRALLDPDQLPARMSSSVVGDIRRSSPVTPGTAPDDEGPSATDGDRAARPISPAWSPRGTRGCRPTGAASHSSSPGSSSTPTGTAPRSGWSPPTAAGHRGPSPRGDGDDDVGPAWSPDGRYLALTRSTPGPDPRHRLVLLPVDGPGEPVTLVERDEAIGELA